MSQNDLSIANQGFASFRSDLNSALQALGSTNSGTSAPSTTYANQLFYDTTNNILKIRNEDNDAFISLFTLDQSNDNIESLTINGAFACEGFTSNGIDDNADATAITITSAELVGIGTSPSTRLHVYQATGNTALRVESAEANAQASINFKNDARRYDVGINSSDSFFISDDTASSTRLTINSSGNVGIGTSSPSLGSSANGMHITGASGNDGVLKLDSSDTSHSGKIQFTENGTDQWRIAYDPTNNHLEFTESGVADRLVLADGGNVGIGATPSTKFHVQAGTNQNFNVFGPNVFSTGVTLGATTDGFGAFAEMEQRATQFVFHNGTTERMRIDSNGDVGIGSTTPGGLRLFVTKAQSTGSNVVQFTNTTSSGNVFCVGTSINSNGNNTSSFHVRSVTQGVLTAGLLGNGTQTFTSDERLKKNIETTRDGYLEDLAKLRVVKYNWHNHEEGTPKELGLIAQEVEKVFPNLIRTDDDLDLNGVTDPKELESICYTHDASKRTSRSN